MKLSATKHAKMNFLIQRRTEVSRDELIMHWFKNHMPAVIESQKRAFANNRAGAHRYIAQLFDSDSHARTRWDGMAQLWFDEPQRPERFNFGKKPSDSFQEKAEPYSGWATREYVIVDGSEELSTAPLELNEPYPSTRSGFFRINYLVAVKDDVDYDRLFKHWLDVHVPNVRDTMAKAGGFRYVVSHSIYPGDAPYAGMAELYFRSEEGWTRYRNSIKADGMEQWVDTEHMQVLRGGTEMIGIP